MALAKTEWVCVRCHITALGERRQACPRCTQPMMEVTATLTGDHSMTFTVFGAPATKGSTVSFQGKRGMVVLPDCKTLAAWTQAVGWAARARRVAMAPAGSGVVVDAVFQFVRPKSDPNRPHPTVKPDIDKLLRALLDALTGVGYLDDAQVVYIGGRKVYGADARTTITITTEQ